MTDLLKLPGEAESMVRGAGHHPELMSVRTNGVSGHLNGANNGKQHYNTQITCSILRITQNLKRHQIPTYNNCMHEV